jgi:hypothetical protein
MQSQRHNILFKDTITFSSSHFIHAPGVPIVFILLHSLQSHFIHAPGVPIVFILLHSLQSHFILFCLEETHHFLLTKGNTLYGRKRTHSIETTNSMRMRCMGTDTKHSASQILSHHDNSMAEGEHVLLTKDQKGTHSIDTTLSLPNLFVPRQPVIGGHQTE